MSYNYYHPDWEYEEGKELSDMADVAKGCFHMIFTMIAFIVLLCLVLCMVSCTTTKYVEVPGPSHTDTTYITKWQHDSIFQRDSIHVTEKGDTVQIDRWHTKYIQKVCIDTMQHIVRDTIPKPYPVEVEVPAQLTWWQQTKIHIGGVVFWLALLVFFLWLGKKKLRL